ncbi:MAG TPA: ATP-binding protein [Pyrinomonadaceae bacterium]|jgi:serine/threonine-protein kinase RsbW|nr:ATP-binding protein [Pyrinomonadaceae bacterium]
MPLIEQTASETKCSILIVENSDDIRAGLRQEVEHLGHKVMVVSQRDEALAREDQIQFDLLVTDLVNDRTASLNGDVVRSFKLAVTSLPGRRAIPALHDIIERTLSFKLRCIDAVEDFSHVREKIDLELPSDLTLMNAVLEYLLDRVARLGLIEVEQSNLFVALDEAFVNAVKHGNRHDPEKLLRVTAELSAREAIFTVEDEGDGFDVREIPDPCDPANLFKSSGRGVLLIYNIMDEVEYSERGNKLKMVARPKPKAFQKS